MKRTNLWLIFIITCIPLAAISQKKQPAKKPVAQKPKTEKTVTQKPDVVADEKKVREIISFFEYMLNTLGNSSTPTRDKEVLITESYAKIFRDSKVQVEDDLDEERMVIGWQLNLQFSTANLSLVESPVGPIQSCVKADRPRSSLAPYRMLPKRTVSSPPSLRQAAAVRLFRRSSEPTCGPSNFPKQWSSA